MARESVNVDWGSAGVESRGHEGLEMGDQKYRCWLLSKGARLAQESVHDQDKRGSKPEFYARMNDEMIRLVPKVLDT